MASLSADLTRNPPAGKPPPGVMPNYTNPYSQGPIFFVAGSIMLFIMLVFFSIRMFAKFGVHKKRTWDDLTCSVAALATTLYFAAFILAITRAKIGRHNWDVPAAHLLTTDFLIPAYLINATAAPVRYFTKLTLFLLYLQIFRPFRWFRYCVYAGIGLCTAGNVAFTTAQFYFTTPSRGQTWAGSLQDPKFQKEFKMIVPVTAFGLAFDIYLLILPITAVSKLQLSRQRKLGVIAIFTTGLGAVIASTMNLVYKIQLYDNNNNDFMYLSFNIATCSFVEMCVGVIVSCMPSLALLVHHPASKSLWSKVTGRHGSSSAFKNRRLASVKHEHSHNKSKYANLAGDQSGKSSHDVELGLVGNLRTSITGGFKGTTPSGGIYTTQEVQQWSKPI